MKRSKWDKTKWTEFRRASFAHYPDRAKPHDLFMNSIYQVSVWYDKHPIFGEFAHLSFKTHDREARHDWREMQRIKNELCGEETWGIQFFPPESKLVDTSNQYHLYVFRTFKFEGIGFTERLVAEGSYGGAVQRPFRPELRPTDLKPREEMEKELKEFMDPSAEPVIKSKT